MNVPDTAEKIYTLYNVLRKSGSSPNELADKINSILIYGYGIPLNILGASWDFFAKQKGVANE